MQENSLVDTTLGIKSQAYAILHCLVDRYIDLKGLYPQTAAWYNGREKGIVIFMHSWSANKQINISFGDHRNSDSIFVDVWETEGTMNPPTVKDFTEEAYTNRRYFGYMEILPAVEYIIESAQKYINRVKPVEEKIA